MQALWIGRSSRQLIASTKVSPITPTPQLIQKIWSSKHHHQHSFHSNSHFKTNDSSHYMEESPRGYTQQQVNSSSGPQFELVRDFIYDSLYNPNYGYFNSQEPLIFYQRENELDETTTTTADKNTGLTPLINFQQLKDQREYISNLKQLYASQNQVWGTPVEIFQPYFAQSILNYILSKWNDTANGNDLLLQKKNSPLIIYEIGGGTGTCALNILATLKRDHPSIYSIVQYHIIEISSELHKIQKNRLAELFEGHITCHHKSVFDFEPECDDDENVFVIALEVMDNLPHDKIVEKGDGSFSQIVVAHRGTSDNGQPIYEEVEMPLTDSLIHQYLQYTRRDLLTEGDEEGASGSINESNMVDLRPKKNFKSWFTRSTDALRKVIISVVGVGDQIYFIPTMQLLMVQKICNLFPKHHLLLADFDSLPQNDLIMYTDHAIHNQPIVQRKFEKSIKFRQDQNNYNKEYLSSSFSTYLVPKGTCDIFFETNFTDLQRVYAHCREELDNGSTVMKMSQFMSQFLPEEKLNSMETQSGYNPALRDYSNFSVMVTGSSTATTTKKKR